MLGMRDQGALTGQRLLKVLETVEKPLTPSQVSKVQVIYTFPYLYIRNSLTYTHISKIVKEWIKKTNSLSWFRNGILHASMELPHHFSFKYSATLSVATLSLYYSGAE